MLSEDSSRRTPLFARFDDCCNKPREKHTQQQQTVDPGQDTVKKKYACNYWDYQRNREVSFHSIAWASNSGNQQRQCKNQRNVYNITTEGVAERNLWPPGHRRADGHRQFWA